jgi:hypothetical protein
LGQFGPLAASASKFVEGLGFGERNFSDITGDRSIKKIIGTKRFYRI